MLRIQPDTNAILYRGQVYRCLTGSLTFQSAGEIILGSLILLNLSRRFEREMGSRKYCIWLATILVLSTVLLILLAMFQLTTALGAGPYSGPYPVLGALTFLFHRFTPRLHPRFFGLLGLYCSEKILGYAFCLQVMFYRGYTSLVPSLCGAFCAWLWTTQSWLQSYLDVPDMVASTVSATIVRYVGDDSPIPYFQPQLQQQQQQQQQFAQERFAHAPGFPQAQPAAAAAPLFEQMPPPPESSIEQLTSMGFEREAVLRALQQSHNDVERAADKLLTGSL